MPKGAAAKNLLRRRGVITSARMKNSTAMYAKKMPMMTLTPEKGEAELYTKFSGGTLRPSDIGLDDSPALKKKKK